MLTQLIDLLHQLELDSTPKEIGEMLWLAEYLDAPGGQNTESTAESTIKNLPHAGHQSDSASKIFSLIEQPTVGKESQAKLYSGQAQEAKVATGGIKGIDFRTPGVPALPGALDLARALRPLKRTTLSRTQRTFDEKASINAAADAGNPIPVLRPAPSRWLDVVLVVDESPSMVIWSATIQELLRLLERQGAFRNVQLWHLQYDSEHDEPRLQIGVGNMRAQRTHQASELIDPSGQRLILIVTDCVSPAWDRVGIAILLKTWGAWGPVALVQMLPKYLWSRTALGDMPEVHLRAKLPGLPNAQLDIKWLFDEYDDALRQWLQSQENQRAGIVVPVVTLESRTLASWATALATGNSAWITGFFLPTALLPLPSEDELDVETVPVDELPDARALVESFNKTASPTARKLARYLAAAPLTLPVMRLVQGTMLPNSFQVHLAEVFLSGLIERQMPETADIDLEVQYEFVDGVRDELLGASRVSATLEVISTVSQYIEKHTGQPLNFRSWLADPNSIGEIVINSPTYHFATVATKVMSRLGGKYATSASQISYNLQFDNLGSLLNDDNQQIAQVAAQDSLEPESELPASLSSIHLLQALRNWHNLTYVEPTLARLFIVQRQARLSRQGLHHAINTILEQALAELAQSNLELSELLTLRFLDKQTVAQTMRHINVAEAKLYNMHTNAYTYLIAILLNWEVNALAEQQSLLLTRLEALTNSYLIGIEEHIAHLLERLRTSKRPWIIAIEGLGGIGKTTLANATVRSAIEERIFDEVGWVTARQQRLNVGGLIVSPPKPIFTAETLIEALAKQLLPPQIYRAQSSHEQLLAVLHRQLNEVPHLLVIDNLETVLDLDVLLPTVQKLANPTKFLLTTREALFDIPDVYHFRLPELSQRAALALIRQEIELSNVAALAACTDEELQAIVDVVGGNPLALRLVIGQAHIHDLDQILARLRSAKLETKQGDPVENLYTYIYRHAWQSLTEPEREVLLIMPLVHPDGDELANIADIGGKSIETIRQTLNRLVTLNLIDVHGAANQRFYCIHRLTRTFLEDEILRAKFGVRDDERSRRRLSELLIRGLTMINRQIAATGEERELTADNRGRALNLLDYAFRGQTAWEQSYQLLQTLAPKMERSGERDEWIPYLELGIEASRLYEDTRATAEFALWIGQLYRLRSNFEVAAEWLTRSANHFAEVNDPKGRARALNQLAYVAWSQHANDRAIALAEEALALLEGNELERAMSLSALGLVAIDRQQWQAAEEHHRQALLLRKTHRQPRLIGWSLQNLAIALRGRQRYEVAIEHFVEAIVLLEQAHDPANRAIAQMNLGVTYSWQNQFTKALVAYGAAAATLREVGDEYNLAKVLVNQGIAYMTLRDWQQAEPLFLAACNLFKAQKIQGQYLNALDGLGICYLEQARYAEALPIFEEVATHLDNIKDTPLYLGLISKIEYQLQRTKEGIRGFPIKVLPGENYTQQLTNSGA